MDFAEFADSVDADGVFRESANIRRHVAELGDPWPSPGRHR